MKVNTETKSNKGLFFSLHHRWPPLKRPSSVKLKKNNLVIMTHQLWKACGAAFVWINVNVALTDPQRFWGVALWPALGGCCFVRAAAGGSCPWVFVACELEPFWHISRLPGDLTDQAQVAAFTSCHIMKRGMRIYYQHFRVQRGVGEKTTGFLSFCFWE